MAAVAAANETVEIDRCAAREGQHDIFVEIGQVDVARDIHAADVVIIDESEVEPVHFLAAGVDRLGGQEGDLACQRTARKIFAARMRKILARVADTELGRPRNSADSILDLDLGRSTLRESVLKYGKILLT